MGEHAKNAKREGKVRIPFADRWIANWTFTPLTKFKSLQRSIIKINSYLTPHSLLSKTSPYILFRLMPIYSEADTS